MKILISINLDKFIELCNDNGVIARYLSEKETMNYKKKHNTGLLIWDKKGIIIDERMVLGDGTIVKMIFDFVKPSSIIKNLKQRIKDYKLKKD